MSQELAEYQNLTKSRQDYRFHRLECKVTLFIDTVMKQKTLTVSQRVRIAGNFLRDRVVIALSRPVFKERLRRTVIMPDGTKKTQTTTRVHPESRSKRGEYPRADTTRLMKDIFHNHVAQSSTSYIGTTLKYGLVLETTMQRSFLRRSLNLMRQQILRIVQGRAT